MTHYLKCGNSGMLSLAVRSRGLADVLWLPSGDAACDNEEEESSVLCKYCDMEGWCSLLLPSRPDDCSEGTVRAFVGDDSASAKPGFSQCLSTIWVNKSALLPRLTSQTGHRGAFSIQMWCSHTWALNGIPIMESSQISHIPLYSSNDRLLKDNFGISGIPGQIMSCLMQPITGTIRRQRGHWTGYLCLAWIESGDEEADGIAGWGAVASFCNAACSSWRRCSRDVDGGYVALQGVVVFLGVFCWRCVVVFLGDLRWRRVLVFLGDVASLFDADWWCDGGGWHVARSGDVDVGVKGDGGDASSHNSNALMHISLISSTSGLTSLIGGQAGASPKGSDICLYCPWHAAAA